ncbi:3'(2'),5'-bisphosphate nucleotidase CysQ [Nitrospirota bacterium]
MAVGTDIAEKARFDAMTRRRSALMGNELVHSIAEAARDAGAGIMDIYDSGDFGVEMKSDNSPLTRADMLSHEIIVERLAHLTPDIPVISEEGSIADYAIRKDWRRFYLVDPLDGTKSFIKRSGEFTVNIALLDEGVPVLGVIYSPVSDTLYFSSAGEGSYKVMGKGEPIRIETANPGDHEVLVAVISRSHRTSEEKVFVESGIVGECIASGSSLKFCLVAEGKAHIYPRFGPLWEWDTAAGHAILIEAGGRVVDVSSYEDIIYNKKGLLHGGLLAMPQWLLPEITSSLDNNKP